MDDNICVEKSFKLFDNLGEKVFCLTRWNFFETLYGYCKASEIWFKYKSFKFIYSLFSTTSEF